MQRAEGFVLERALVCPVLKIRYGNFYCIGEKFSTVGEIAHILWYINFIYTIL